MKTLLPAAILVTAIAALAPPAVRAQEGGHGLSFDLGVGSRNLPRYEGSDETMTRPWAVLRNFDFGSDAGGPPDMPRQGFTFGPSLALISRQKTGPSAPEPLRGLDSVDAGVEIGLGAGYQAGPMRFYGAARKAIRAHRGVTGEMGVSLTMRPAPQWTVTPSLEAQYGDQKFMDAYFGVSAAEADRSGHPEYHAGSGIKAYAVAVEARWQATEDWSLLGRVQAKRLTGDAADSPVVKDRDQFWFGFGVMRSFNFRF